MVYYRELPQQSVRGKGAAACLLPAAWTFAPIFAVEKLADYYFLAHDPAMFYTFSGWRLILFIAFTLAGSVAAGAFLKEFWAATATEAAAIVGATLAFNVFCDPRVCFSTGPDGLEPLRLGAFLLSVAASGAALGVSLRRMSLSKSAEVMTAFTGFAAIAYYPVIFTFAGTTLLAPLGPWDVGAVLALAAFPASVGVSLKRGPLLGFLAPLSSLGLLFALSAGIASAYLSTLVPVVLLMVVSTAAGTLAGAAAVSKRRGSVLLRRPSTSGLYAVGVAIVLSMLIFTVPDAVNGVVPVSGSPPFQPVMGVPAYVGAYMDAPPGHSAGAAATVDFEGTDSSSIQGDNFLAAGIGIHSAGCCVDGIDYSYRFDVYLFHGGGETLQASAWEVCDDNAACGGHSWKVLMFLRDGPLNSANVSAPVRLAMSWEQGARGPEVVWSYSVAGGNSVGFASFAAPAVENPNFNTGMLPGGTLGPQQTGSYFFQFGMMSRYPIGHGGWTVAISCPSLLTTQWSCVDHAKTLQGGQSFWKVFWRWGEDYPNVKVSAAGTDRIAFGYSPTSVQSFVALW